MLGIIALTANLAAFGLLLGAEALISRLGWIDSRIPTFRYLRNRNVFRIGDAIGLSLVAFAVGAGCSKTGFPPVWYIFLALAVALVLTGIMHRVRLRQPVRDSAYPPGGISLVGILHLLYLAGYVAWVLVGLWHVIDLSILGFILVGIAGGIVWGVTLHRDGKKDKEG